MKLAEGLWDRDDYVAGDAKRRGEDLNALFADPEVDVVQALQGGFGSAQAIPYLDFDLIAENPKPLVGYSDLTALHAAIRQRAGVATVYGNGLMGVGSVETTAFASRGARRHAARRRLPLAAHADDGHAAGDRARRSAILFFGARSTPTRRPSQSTSLPCVSAKWTRSRLLRDQSSR